MEGACCAVAGIFAASVGCCGGANPFTINGLFAVYSRPKAKSLPGQVTSILPARIKREYAFV